MARFYYLGPWRAPTVENDAWHAPEGTVGLIDLRPIQASLTYGFFATNAPLNDSDYEPFGDAQGTHLGGLTMSPQQRSRWASMLGIADTIQPGTLLDVLWDTLTVYSDPDGTAHAKPIMPTSQGVLELHLGGHSLVRSARIPRDVRDTPHWAKMQRVLQNDFRAVAAQVAKGKSQKERDLHARWLGFMRDKFRLTDDAATALLVPGDMPRTAPKRPETTITDNFNRADARPLDNSAEGWSWAQVGTTATDRWEVFGNYVRHNGSETWPCAARAESDLSGTDHYAQFTLKYVYPTDSGTVGVAARFDAAAHTHYGGANWANFYADPDTLGPVVQKIVTGTDTSLTTPGSVQCAVNDVLRLICNGSTISINKNGSEAASVTDTAITSGVRAGLYGRNIGDVRGWDDFEASDLSSPPSGLADLVNGGLVNLGLINGGLVR